LGVVITATPFFEKVRLFPQTKRTLFDVPSVFGNVLQLIRSKTLCMQNDAAFGCHSPNTKCLLQIIQSFLDWRVGRSLDIEELI